jgi:hypothetical protein
MNILRILFELFVVYLVYKLIFDFIIPVYKTSKQVKRKMNDMHQRMQQQQNESHVKDNFTSSSRPVESKRAAHEDYIDYEEIK